MSSPRVRATRLSSHVFGTFVESWTLSPVLVNFDLRAEEMGTGRGKREAQGIMLICVLWH